MISPRRIFLASVSTFVLAASLCFTTTGCHPKAASHPEPFTAKLTEIEGVQAVYTLRHPKLINGELEHLMTAVPEAALARMFLGQLSAYGYPEFSEFAADTNIGIALLEMSADDLKAGNPVFVAVAKLKEGGKIWSILKQSGLSLEKKGEWVWIAKEASAIAAVKNPAALIAHISQPQTEEVRIWGRVSPALLAAAKTALFPKLEAKLATLPSADQKAALAYADVLWGYLAQLHSAGGAIDLNERGLGFSYYGQFLPDSATGTLLRYAHPASPKITESVPADGLLSVVVRQNIPGQIAFVTGVLDALSAVNYPAGADALKAAKAAYLGLSEHNDGGVVASINMSLPKASQPPEMDMLGVYTGHYTEAEITNAYKSTLSFSEKFTHSLLQTISLVTPGHPVPTVTQKHTENALTIDGISFGSVVTTTVMPIGDTQQTNVTTQYYGVVNGNLIFASNEATLRAKLPAIAGKRPVANPIKIVLKGDEFGVMVLHGEKIVDAVVTATAVDTTDADIQAQIKSMKDGYAAAEPVTTTVNVAQAKAELAVFIPYSFVTQSLRLAQFANAHKAK